MEPIHLPAAASEGVGLCEVTCLSYSGALLAAVMALRVDEYAARLDHGKTAHYGSSCGPSWIHGVLQPQVMRAQ